MAFLRIITSSLIISFLITISSCSEDGTPASRSVLIAGSEASGKTWAITGIQLERGSLIVEDCIADNIIRYFPNGRYTISEGLELCSANDPISWEGTWSLSRDETQIFIVLPDSSLTWGIETLNSRTQVISSVFDGDLETYTLSSSN